ncbi:hypothetical protein [Rhodanobacter sp. T12-5]|uniref:hypothetical protein n=1 Tax=Rhodanobacter sp. T12-5 TaxID=2024611 RepID=UPI0011EE4875|nr:hypothetical protein [Rhodanobacter sp. T12-5]
MHWYAQLYSLLPVGPARSYSSLPVHDLTSSFASKTSIRPLPAPTDNLRFSMWRLAHAVKKAECVNPVLASMANSMTLGFLLENQHLFDYSGTQFNLADGAASYLDDFSQTGLTGRVAQGFALLQMENEGYAFVGRFDTFRKKCGVAVPTVPSRRRNRLGKLIPKRIRSPDFVVETKSGDRALVESKGSFLNGGKVADIKGSMSDALKQLAPWGSQFSPAITKKFAVGTYLREPESTDREPSLMAIVDPEGGQDEDAVPVPPDLVRRLNYAGWLSAMGYRAPSRNLVSPHSTDRVRETFQVAEFGGGRYAYVPIAWVPPQKPDDLLRVFHLPTGWPGEYSIANFHETDNQMIVVLALDIQVLERVARASRSRSWSSLEDASSDPGDAGAFTKRDDERGNRFSDGSFMGLVRLEQLFVSSYEAVTLDF